LYIADIGSRILSETCFHLCARPPGFHGRRSQIQSTEWLYDGTKTTNPSVKLSAGKHVVTARIHYHDGSQEELTLELNVR
jgi:hypothetical protein